MRPEPTSLWGSARTRQRCAQEPATGGLNVELGDVDRSIAMRGEGTLSADGTSLRMRVEMDTFRKLSGRSLSKGSRVYDMGLMTVPGAVLDFLAAFPPTHVDDALTTRTYSGGGASCVRAS